MTSVVCSVSRHLVVSMNCGDICLDLILPPLQAFPPQSAGGSVILHDLETAYQRKRRTRPITTVTSVVLAGFDRPTMHFPATMLRLRETSNA